MKRVFILLLAFSFLLPVLSVPASADYSGFDDSNAFNAIGNEVKYISNVLSAAKQLGNGEIDTAQFLSIVAENAASCTSASLKGVLNQISTNCELLVTKGPRAVVDYTVNCLRDFISGNGGNVSGFPSINTTLTFEQGYVVFEPYTAWYIYSDGGSRYEIYATAYYNNGTVAVSRRQVYTTNPQKNNILDNGGGILRIYLDTTIDMGNGGTRLQMLSDCYNWSYPNVQTVSFSFDVPWVVSDDSPVDVTNLSPDVDVLSDDDLFKYIDNLINNLNTSYPDLSTIDGKLQEILNKMDKLGNGCNCAELATSINALLDYLRENGGNSDNTELNNTLTELNNTLKNDINLKPIQDRLDDIYDVLSDIKLTLEEGVTEDSAEEDMTDSYEHFKKSLEDKFHVSTIKSSIDAFSSVIFGSRAFSNDPKTGKVTVAAVYGDGSRSSASFVSLNFDFKFMGKTITLDLFEWVSFIPAATMETVRGFISFVLWFSFLLGLFRSLPGILSSGSTARALITDYVHNDD